jgi:hypothetical protein
VDNAQQVALGSTRNGIPYQSIHTWDDGYPSGGNYWRDYNGTDLYGGLYQNETGSDGIGDTPFTLGENNTDNYPLMDLFQDFSVGYEEETYHVTAISNSTISAFQFDEVNKKISFNVTGLDETVGFCRVTVPTNLLKADATNVLKVFVNNIEINYTTAEKGNHTFIFFSYTHSIQKVQIILERLPTPFWMQWWFWAIVATGIALAGTVYLFLKKKKPPTSTAPPLPTEGALEILLKRACV